MWCCEADRAVSCYGPEGRYSLLACLICRFLNIFRAKCSLVQFTLQVRPGGARDGGFPECVFWSQAARPLGPHPVLSLENTLLLQVLPVRLPFSLHGVEATSTESGDRRCGPRSGSGADCVEASLLAALCLHFPLCELSMITVLTSQSFCEDRIEYLA